jgi:hypothetical protein
MEATDEAYDAFKKIVKGAENTHRALTGEEE